MAGKAPFPTDSVLQEVTVSEVTIFSDIICEPATNPFLRVSKDIYNAAMYPNIPIARVCTFSGEISRGQTYQYLILDDLKFCLVPEARLSTETISGWRIIISDSKPGSCNLESENYVNFGPIVTPPHYGNLWFDVFGWHFRNKDNTGPNDGSVNAPQNYRSFNFVLNRDDFQAAWHSARCTRWGMDEDCIQATQTPNISNIPRTSATFTITDIELGNLVQDSRAWIEYMEFRVDVYLADE